MPCEIDGGNKTRDESLTLSVRLAPPTIGSALPFPRSLDLEKASSCFESSALRSKNEAAFTLALPFLLLDACEFDMVVEVESRVARVGCCVPDG